MALSQRVGHLLGDLGKVPHTYLDRHQHTVLPELETWLRTLVVPIGRVQIQSSFNDFHDRVRLSFK